MSSSGAARGGGGGGGTDLAALHKTLNLSDLSDPVAARAALALLSAATHPATDFDAAGAAAAAVAALGSAATHPATDFAGAAHRAQHASGGADPVGSVGTVAQLAAVDPTTVPAGYPFLVTNDPTWGMVEYRALGSPQTWQPAALLNSSTGGEIAPPMETVGTFDATSAAAVNIGAPLSFNAPGFDYRVLAFVPIVSVNVASIRGQVLMYDEAGAPAGFVGFGLTSLLPNNINNGASLSLCSKKITGIAAGTAKQYQLVNLRPAENTGTQRVASITLNSVIVPITVRAVRV